MERKQLEAYTRKPSVAMQIRRGVYLTFIILLAFFVMDFLNQVVGIIWFIFTPINRPSPISCLSNIKQLGLGMLMYSQDYDECFPLAASWNEVISPYVRHEGYYRCPQEPNQTVPSYAFNGRLQSLSMEKVESPEGTVLLFESVPGKDLAGGKELFPFPPRHTKDNIGCYNLGFADGHVQTFKVPELSALNWDPRKHVNKGDDQK